MKPLYVNTAVVSVCGFKSAHNVELFIELSNVPCTISVPVQLLAYTATENKEVSFL